MNKSKQKEWWRTLFDEKYLKTYIDVVTPEITQQQIKFLIEKLGIKKGGKILDLACGHGRLSLELANKGYKVIGSDYFDLAKAEAKEKNIPVKFAQQDMRKLNEKSKFDAVINIFTSFGYFENEKDNELVLDKIRTALKPKGKF